jgi:hypothetical protein
MLVHGSPADVVRHVVGAGVALDLLPSDLAVDGLLVGHRVLAQADPFHGHLWVPETRRTSCGLLILVEQPTESVASSDVVDLGSGALGQGS